jgi:arginine/ornithine transport system permease protein
MLKGYGAVILDGAWLTLQLALSSMALAIVLGLIGVALRLSPVRWLAWLGDLYSTVIRGIPDLVLILLIFYGGQDLLNRLAPLLGYDDYIDLNPLVAGIGTLGFIFGPTCRKPSAAPSWAFPRGRPRPVRRMA